MLSKCILIVTEMNTNSTKSRENGKSIMKARENATDKGKTAVQTTITQKPRKINGNNPSTILDNIMENVK